MAVGALLGLAALASLTLAGSPAKAAFPGANGKLVCVGALERAAAGQPAAIDRDSEIYTIDPDGGGQTFLTNNGPFLNPPDPTYTVEDLDPVFSPDSRQIAFESDRTGQPELYTTNADGSNQKRLTFALGEEVPGSYSPDGRQILFHSARSDTDLEIYVMNADGSDQRRLTSHVGTDSDPAWSPKGDRIVFRSSRRPGEPGNGDPAGTPPDDEIYTMNTSGGDIRRLTTRPGSDLFPQWSPDGNKIVFRRDLSAAESGSIANSEIFTMNADGSNQVNLSDNAVNDPATTAIDESFEDVPVWSPDGTRIVFESNRSGDTEVHTMNAADGSDVRRLTNQPGPDGRCDWGRLILPAVNPPAPNPPPPVASFAGCPNLTANVIRGGAAGGRITGTVAGDRIFGGTGNDVVDGLAGDDCIDLGPGTDTGQGGLGDDLMLGGLGEDRMAGNSGSDRVRGGPSGDRVDGGFGNDRLHGQSGKDSVSGSRGRDRINGGSSNDVISAGSSSDRVAGDQGSDRINGNSGNDVLKGNSGNDRVKGSTGRDRISGGGGKDRLDARDGRGGDRVACGIGGDRVVADRGDRVARDCERVTRMR